MSIPVSQVRVCQPLNHAKQDMNAYGGIREMSELDPLPGVVGFCSVVSTSVQPSPLNPQLPFAPSTVECVNKHGRVGEVEKSELGSSSMKASAPYRSADNCAAVGGMKFSCG